MGCAECKLLGMMRRRPHVEELFGVDIDGQLLRSRVSSIEPLTTDYLNRRERPLRISLMQGGCTYVQHGSIYTLYSTR